MQPPSAHEPNQPPADVVPMPQPMAAPAPAASSTPTAPLGGLPSVADDGDMIEKEWVEKAKQVLSSSADDPYEQNQQFTRLRADYMQKRYGKDIKVDS